MDTAQATRIQPECDAFPWNEGDWAAYNWLDDDGSDCWKVGRIVQTECGLMYFNEDGTNRSGYIPLTSSGVKKLINA